MKILITGRVISKKNSRDSNGRGGSRPSKAFYAFQTDALWQLKMQSYTTFVNPVEVHYMFYFQGKMWSDVDNAICSINDVLQEAKILANDRLVTKGTFEIITDCEKWRTEVDITYRKMADKLDKSRKV